MEIDTLLDEIAVTDGKEPKWEHRCFVRFRTVWWSDNRGVHQRKSITWLKKLGGGHFFVQEDVSNVGPELMIQMITNFNEVKDGIYEMVITNTHTDWETGHVDDYDYKLVPHMP
jgi:hypothetical protein